MRHLALVLLFACAGSSQSSPQSSDEPSFIASEERCQSDDECVITDFPGCCACCSCSSPYAIRGDALTTQRAECVGRDCTDEHESQGCAAAECMGCPTTYETFHAVCEAGRCTRVPDAEQP